MPLVLSAVPFAIKRLWSHRLLAVCLLTGLAAAISLATAVPLYADGVNYTLLQDALAKTAVQSGHAPFAFIFHYVGSWHQPLDPQGYTPLDTYMQTRLERQIGLPRQRLTRYVSSGNLPLYPDSGSVAPGQRLALVKLAFVDEIFEHITLVEGQFPSLGGRVAGGEGTIEALAPLGLANDLGLEAGQTYLLYRPAAGAQPAVRLRVRITGIWRPAAPSDSFWFYPPSTFDKRLLVPEETFFGPLAATVPQAVDEAVWRFDFDGCGVYGEDVPGLLTRITQVQTQVAALLPGTDLETSPMPALGRYRQAAQSLASLLFVFSAPVLGLTIYFLGLAAGMLVRRQRGEIAVLRSRGASRRWVLLVYGVEWTLLGLAALLLGLSLGRQLARLVSRTQSFLDFSRVAAVPLRLTGGVLVTGLLMGALAVCLSLFPAWQAARHTVVSYKQERARRSRSHLWQRTYLDFLLLALSLYGLHLLRAEGALRLMGRTLGARNPFENPLLFLLPTLFILALSLLLLRFLPRLLSGLAWLATRLPWTVPLLALRRLARAAGGYLGPLLLMLLTLGLAGFAASMAHSLDNYLRDNAYYQAGADLNLVEGGEYSSGDALAQPGAPPSPESDSPAVWRFLPISDHLDLPGVQAATRVGRYPAEIQAGGRRAGGKLLGIDRPDFPAVAFFREDFASEPFIALINRLASDPAALLVDQDTWERFHLQVGDTVQVSVNLNGRQTIPFKVAGVTRYFPTLYPEEGPFFIANLEYIFESLGGLQPYEVWLRTAPQADTQAIILGINQLGAAVVTHQDARATLETAFGAPSRQGMLGLLSVGFLAAALLTALGFLLYALLSFQERFIQLGVLRAVGLSRRQMAAALALEQLLLIFMGMAGGTGIAVLTATLFIPHLPVVMGAHPGTPPYVVAIAWGELRRVYLVFGFVLLAGIGLTLASLARMRIFQALKLGETL